MNVIDTPAALTAEMMVMAVREFESWILARQGHDCEIVLCDQSFERSIDCGQAERSDVLFCSMQNFGRQQWPVCFKQYLADR